MSDQIGRDSTGDKRSPSEHSANDKGYRSIIITNNTIPPKQPDKDREKPNWVDKGVLFVLFLTLVAACMAAYQAWNLSRLTESALKDNREQYATLSRASVSLKDIDFVPTKDGDNISWYLEPTFDNSGATPTNGLTARVNYITVTDIPTGFSRCVFDSPETRIPIGPRSSAKFQIIPIPPGDIESFQKHVFKHFYVWGKSKYLDIISGKTHRTSFCWDIANITGNPNDASSKLTVIHGLCTEGNCIDDECDQEDKANYQIADTPGGCHMKAIRPPPR